MLLETSRPVKIAYCLNLLTSVLPIGLTGFGWIGGAILRIPFLPLVIQITIFAIVLRRIGKVALESKTLNSPQTFAVFDSLRSIGISCMYASLLIFGTSLLSIPILGTSIWGRTDNGVQNFVAGLYVYIAAAAIGFLGFLLFELSRMLAFKNVSEPKVKYRLYSK